MQTFFQGFVLLLCGSLQLSVHGILILLIFNKKLNWKPILLFGVVNVFPNELIRAIVPQYPSALFIVTYVLIMLLSLKCVFRLNYVHTFIGTFILVLLNTALEYFCVTIFKIVLQEKYDVALWTQFFPHNMIMRNSGTVLNVIAAVIVFYFKMKIIIPEDVNKKRILGILVNSILAIIIIVPNNLFFEHSVTGVPTELLAFNVFSILILLSLSFYNAMKWGELETKNQTVEFQKLYIKTLDDTIDKLRGFKHDYNNIVQVIGGYLALNNINGLKEFHRQMQSETRVINNILPLNSYLIEAPALYGLLLSKISYSEIYDINFNITISSPIRVQNVRIYDLCKILGILLDNAMEAALESEKKLVELSIKEDSEKNGLVIEISNTFHGEINMEKIFQVGYTTKNDHSGFGLWEVRKLLSKYYNCLLNTYVSGNMFTQQLRMGC